MERERTKKERKEQDLKCTHRDIIADGLAENVLYR